MKVKCINIYNEHKKQFEQTSYWLTIGAEYIVLEIVIYLGKGVLYRLVGDNENKSPGLYNASQFEVVSGEISARWKIQQVNSAGLIIGPEAWHEPEFWQKCYDHDPAALEIYKREARFIFEEENTRSI